MIPVTFVAHENATLPRRQTEDSFGYDLAALETVTIPARSVRAVPTGLRLAFPLPFSRSDGVAMLILPRGSLSIKKSLLVANSPGLVDAYYGEDIGLILYNFSDVDVQVAAGDRLAQALFVRVELPAVATAPHQAWSMTRSGFGSTGTV